MGKIKKTTLKAGKLMISPFKWYVNTTAKSLGYMCRYGEDIKYIRFWM